MNGTAAFYHHEMLYRRAEAMRRLREIPVTVCGAGALGANSVEGLAWQGFARLRVIDRDRIEAHNLSTQPFQSSDIGAFKAKILANIIYRAVGVVVEARAEELSQDNAARLLRGSELVIDTFDNSASRRAVGDYCAKASVACLHAGLADGYGEVIWNEVYRVPGDAGKDGCDYPLARNLVMLTAAVACETAARFAADGRRESFTITLGDLAVRRYIVGA